MSSDEPKPLVKADLCVGNLSAQVSIEDRYGWCGLSDLRHLQSTRKWLLSPALTLEHYIGVPNTAPEYVQYEPCHSPKSLIVTSPVECTLIYQPVKCSKLKCAITYKMKNPHYVDVMVQAQTGRSDWPFGSVALFFATIVNAPIYSGITLLGKDPLAESKRENNWVYFNGLSSRPGRTAHPSGVSNPELGRPADPPDN